MRKRYVKLLTGIAIVVIAMGLIYAIWVALSAARVRRAYAAMEKDGRPMHIADVIPPEVPDTENAALLYESAILLLKAHPAPEGNLLDYIDNLLARFLKKSQESLETAQLAELQDLLKHDVVTQALSTIQRGANRPACRFDLDYNAGWSMLLPHLSDLRTIGNILGVKAQFEAEAGRPDSAWDLTLTQLKFADALRTEPLIISQVVRIANIGFACQTIQRLCAVSPPNQQQYDVLAELLKGLDGTAPLVQAVDGEWLIFGDSLFTLPKAERRKAIAMLSDEDHMPGIVREVIFRRISFKPLLLADHAAYLQLMNKHAEMLARPYSRERIDELSKAVNNAGKHNLLTSMLVPSLAKLKELHTQRMAEARITRAGLALLRYKEKHHALPKGLDGLQLEDLDDPFSKGPLRYQAQPDGFLLYSIGADQEDNGGHSKEPKQNTDYDIVWHFPEPAAD